MSIAKIGKGTDVTSKVHEEIEGMSLAGWSVSEFAIAMHRNGPPVRNYLELGSAYNRKRQNSGRNPNSTPGVQRSIFRLTCEERYTSQEIKETLQLDVSTPRLRNVLSKSLHYKYKKPLSCPPLTEDHQDLRMDWARSIVQLTD